MTHKKLRRSGRVQRSVPILLIGSDTDGRVFSESTQTVMLSLHGAGIVSAHKLLAEQELTLRLTETGNEAEIRVVGEIGQQGDKHTYGVAFLDDGLDFWGIDFPPPPSVQERPLELDLECTACGTTVTLLNGDYEFDVCAIHGGLVRYCHECGFATVWRRPEPGAPPAPRRKPERRREEPVQQHPAVAGRVEPESELELETIPLWKLQTLAEATPAPETRSSFPAPRAAAAENHTKAKTATAVEDRRNRVRAKVNYFACVRSEAFGEDIVPCIDMSRGGVGFRTKNEYVVPTEVRIAVPFSPESPNAPAIFVAARVVNLRPMPELQMFRCGVMFLPAK
ncbi:MAG TPA: PilZ domain-containing protein [Candidatus Eisenbacteria bacterium]|nr:PilZ domain-containing protein [Candidatus Eisenbacteria bacterium]